MMAQTGMKGFPPVDAAGLVRRLQRPEGPVDVVLDTDTFNEIDDQYALAYLIAHEETLRLKGIYAAPFSNQKTPDPQIGMEQSHEEILRVLGLMGREDLIPLVRRGSARYLPDEATPVPSEAARVLADLAARYSPEAPLYVIAIGAITNVASALLMAPEIRDRIVIVWLGGHALHWHSNDEFNLRQDVAAARVVLGCGAAVVLLPCCGVVSAFATTEPELRAQLKGQGALCDYLYESTVAYTAERSRVLCWSKPIWDVTAVGWLTGAYTRDELIPSPIPAYDLHWSRDGRRHLIRYVYHIERDRLFADLFDQLRRLPQRITSAPPAALHQEGRSFI